MYTISLFFTYFQTKCYLEDEKTFMENPEFSIVSSSEVENALGGCENEFNRKDFSFTGKQLEIPMNYVVKEQNLVVAGIKSCFSWGNGLDWGAFY